MSFFSEMNKPNPKITCPHCGSKKFDFYVNYFKAQNNEKNATTAQCWSCGYVICNLDDLPNQKKSHEQ